MKFSFFLEKIKFDKMKKYDLIHNYNLWKIFVYVFKTHFFLKKNAKIIFKLFFNYSYYVSYLETEIIQENEKKYIYNFIDIFIYDYTHKYRNFFSKKTHILYLNYL